MFEEIGHEKVIQVLHVSRIESLPSIKHAVMLGSGARYFQCTHDKTFIIQTFSPQKTVHDSLDYPQVQGIHLFAGDSLPDVPDYLATLPPGRHIIKSSRLKKADFPLEYPTVKRTAYLSFTAREDWRISPSAELFVSHPGDCCDLLEQVHYKSKDMEKLLKDQGKFFTLRNENGEPAACCAVYQNYEEIWEIGAVAVSPHCRRQGLGTELVRSAVNYLVEQKHRVRYQVNESNLASIGLARKLGLSLFLEYTHWEINPAF